MFLQGLGLGGSNIAIIHFFSIAAGVCMSMLVVVHSEKVRNKKKIVDQVRKIGNKN